MKVGELMRKDYLAVKESEVVSKVLGNMRSGKHTSAVIVDAKGGYRGMLSKRALVRTTVDTAKAKVKNYVMHVARLEPDTSLEDAARLLHASDSHVLPVLGKGKLLGILGARDLLQSMRGRFSALKARDVATSTLITLPEDAPVGRLFSLFREHSIDRIPIVDSAGFLVGVVGLVDYLVRLQSEAVKGRGQGSRGSRKSGNPSKEKRDIHDLPVSNLATKIVETCMPGMPVPDCIAAMHGKRVSDLILVEKGRPVGIVTTKDLLKCLSRA
ncbi:CBS domain-containing protein [Candidatus Woesearchaeota archaeon]|nr:CBS domain-containing protein [Candidatus Woesearchaeota archaeon]